MPADYLRKTGEVLRSGKPIEERLREFCAATGEFLSGAVSSILLFDRDTEDFYLRTTTLRVSPAAQVVHHSSAGTIEDLALRERRAITLCEVHRSTDSRFRGEMFFHPLVSAGEPLGVLVIQSVSASGVAAEKMTALGEAVLLLSDAVGASLREETAAQRMTKIAAINEAGINIISTLDLSRLLKLVATSASLIMEAESCVIRLLDTRSGKYGIREFYGMKTEADQQDLFRMDKRGVTEILRGEPKVLVRETANEEKWKEFSGVARTMIMLPLTRDGEIIGTVSIFDKFPHKTFYPASFNADDMGTFEKFIRYVEKAIGNAIAFETNEKLKNLDASTGLPTLQYFQSRMLHELSRARRFRRRLVLMICEVAPHIPAREFSAIDREEWVIKRLSKVIRNALRGYDVVARISDSKFAMILPEAEDGKMSATPRIKKAITDEVEEIRKSMKDLKVDVRFGHAGFPEDGEDHEKLIFKSNILK
ncbi:MAG TPA: diguanylate cyclase [Candidatus Deferrimicrobiaceae bacterium]|nr:diguanylate cyclase [Candidatus Deferrimicrobiaceae bacterium]